MPPEPPAPAALNVSLPAHRHTTRPLMTAPDDTPDALRRRSIARTPATPASLPRDARKSKDAPLLTPAARSAATDRPAPGCTHKNSASRSLLRASITLLSSLSCHTDSSARPSQAAKLVEKS